MCQYGIPALLWLAWNHTATSFWPPAIPVWKSLKLLRPDVFPRRKICQKCIYKTLMRSLQHSQTPSWIYGGLLLRGGRKRERRQRKKREGKGRKKESAGGREKGEEGKGRGKVIPVLLFSHFKPCQRSTRVVCLREFETANWPYWQLDNCRVWQSQCPWHDTSAQSAPVSHTWTRRISSSSVERMADRPATNTGPRFSVSHDICMSVCLLQQNN